MEDLLRIGIITKPHGVKGEVKVIATTDDLNRFQTVPKVYVTRPNRETEKMQITSVKYQADRVLLKLTGISSIEEAELYRSGEIWIEKSDSDEPKENEYFLSDLIGMEVYRKDESHMGVIEDVYETPAGFTLSIRRDDGKEISAPFVQEWIVSISVEEKKAVFDFVDGLEDV